MSPDKQHAQVAWAAEQLETPNCPLCNHQEAKTRYADGKFATFHIMRCQACDFTYLSPRPSETAMLARYAQDDYFEGQDGGGYASYAAQAQALSLTFQRLMTQLKRRNMSGGHLLEVGCGYGFLLQQAQPFFSKIDATDFSAGALAKAQSFADNIYQGGLDAIPPGQTYDLIIANHVIEHVYHPHDFVAQCKARLKPGGWLLLSTPDAGSFWLKLMGKRWPSFILPDHLLYFSAQHLRSLFTQAGFSTLQNVPYPHAFPASLVAQKLGLTLPEKLGKLSMWLPKTTVAIAGRNET